MFEQSLVISSRQPIQSQRQWSTAAAASLEALVLSVLAVYPLLHPAALPQITSPRAPAPIFSATQPDTKSSRLRPCGKSVSAFFSPVCLLW